MDVDSAIKGEVKRNDGTISDQVGKFIGGLNPLGDARDIIATGKQVLDGENGGWIKFGASIIGAIPGGGDILKPIIKKVGKEVFIKTEQELVTEVAEKLVKEGVEKEVAEKVAKEEVNQLIKDTVTKRYDEISKNGHAVQRHGEAITETQLDERVIRMPTLRFRNVSAYCFFLERITIQALTHLDEGLGRNNRMENAMIYRARIYMMREKYYDAISDLEFLLETTLPEIEKDKPGATKEIAKEARRMLDEANKQIYK